MRAKLQAALVVLAVAGTLSAAQWGCAGGTTAPPSPASSSGAFGVVTVNGKQLMFLPVLAPLDAGCDPDSGFCQTGDSQILVVDVGRAAGNTPDAGTAAQVAVIDMGDGGTPTATAGDSAVIVAAGTETYTVWFIDPATYKITDSIALPSQLQSGNFSGGGGIVDGIAIDEANHRAILSVWNGILFVDLVTHKITGTVLAGGAENFGYDSTRQYVLLPYYDCNSEPSGGDGDGGFATPPPCSEYLTLGDAGLLITDGLNLIDLSKSPAQVYLFENPDGGAQTPLGLSPDSAAVDTTTGMAMVPSESSSFYTFIDLSQAKFKVSGDAGTFTAPSILKNPSATNADADTGVAIESGAHLAFTEAEHTDHVSVIDMTKLGTGDAFAPGSFADGFLPQLPETGNFWSNLGDPHGIAVTTGIQTGAPVGFVVSDQSQYSQGVWVARIDLNKMLQIESGVMTSLTSDQMSPAVTILDATRTK